MLGGNVFQYNILVFKILKLRKPRISERYKYTEKRHRAILTAYQNERTLLSSFRILEQVIRPARTVWVWLNCLF